MEIYNIFTTDCSVTKWKDQENFYDSPFTPIANHCWTLFIGRGYVCCRYLTLVSAFSLSKIKKGEREHEDSKANISYIDLVAKIQQWKGIWRIRFYPMLSLVDSVCNFNMLPVCCAAIIFKTCQNTAFSHSWACIIVLYHCITSFFLVCVFIFVVLCSGWGLIWLYCLVYKFDFMI